LKVIPRIKRSRESRIGGGRRCTRRQNFALIEHLTRAAHIDSNEFLRYLPRDRASGLHARRQFDQDSGNERSGVEQND
jgi:hypothetical protein